jgi:DNA-binding response OmpR family regulator
MTVETTGTTILFVDDQQDYLQAIQFMLGGVGYNVLLCDSGAKALDILAQQQVDLILADIAMPHMNGYQLFEEVRKHPEWATVPFIFLTARALDSDIRYGKALGVDDYLTKPIQPEDLLATIEGKLRRRAHLHASSQTPPAPAAPQPAQKTGALAVGSLHIDPARHQVWRGERLVELSVREFALLTYLVQRAGMVVETREVLRVTHDIDVEDATEARELLRPLVRSLRRKLDYEIDEPGYIETVRGLGYRLLDTAL